MLMHFQFHASFAQLLRRSASRQNSRFHLTTRTRIPTIAEREIRTRPDPISQTFSQIWIFFQLWDHRIAR
jgi:hypothetical protein